MKNVLILNAIEIQEKITRIAYQIYEDSYEEEQIILAGIADRGYVLALRIKNALEQISKLNVLLLKVSLDKESSALHAALDIDVSVAAGKVVVLVDDVLNSGRTLAYGLGVFINVPLKKMRTAVLIDRSHHKFPVVSDFSGHKLSTILQEHVSVTLRGYQEEEDAAFLL